MLLARIPGIKGRPRTDAAVAETISPVGMDDLLMVIAVESGLGVVMFVDPLGTATLWVVLGGADISMTGTTGLVSTRAAARSLLADTDDASASAPRLGDALVRGRLGGTPESDEGGMVIGDVVMLVHGHGPLDCVQGADFMCDAVRLAINDTGPVDYRGMSTRCGASPGRRGG